MNTALAIPNRPRRHRKAAFTLVEMMIGVGIFLGIFVGVMIALQIFGMRVYTIAATKLSTQADARKALNDLRDEIRSAKLVYVGTYTNSFSRITNGLAQTGNALEIFLADTNNSPSTNPIIYYQRSTAATNALYRLSDNVVERLADYVTNNDVFTAEDYRTQTMTSYDNNPVIRVTLCFNQLEYAAGMVNGRGLDVYNAYRLQTRVSRREKD